MSNGDEADIKNIGWKLVPWLADIVCAFLVYYAFQVNAQLASLRDDMQSLKEWKAETTGNRYTSRDHVSYADQVQGEFSKVWSRMAEMQQSWLRDVGDIKVLLARLEARNLRIDDIPQGAK